MNYNTLVLSGGSVKTIAMLGVLQYCYDLKLLNVKKYIGTSAGAIICYLLIIGYTPDELLLKLCSSDILENVRYFDIPSMINRTGAMSFSDIQDYLEYLTIEKIGKLITLKDLKTLFNKELIITTYNYTKKITEYISCVNNPDIPCLIAIRMSTCLPLIFPPFKYMDNYYLDGGISDDFPIEYELERVLNNKANNHRLGIVIDPYNETEPSNTIEYIYELLSIPLKITIQDKLVKYNYVDIIKIGNTINLLNFSVKKIEKINLFISGYNIAKDYYNVQNDYE